MAHYFPYDVKLRLLAHSRSFLANQKARNAIVGAENLIMLVKQLVKEISDVIIIKSVDPSISSFLRSGDALASFFPDCISPFTLHINALELFTIVVALSIRLLSYRVTNLLSLAITPPQLR